MSQDKPHFEDAFREALKNHETAVSPKVWAGVQSSLASTTATTTGSAILGKAAAVIGFTALITAATISEVQHANIGSQAVSEPAEKELPVATNTENNSEEKVVNYAETEEVLTSANNNQEPVSSKTEQGSTSEKSEENAFAEKSEKTHSETFDHSNSGSTNDANQEVQNSVRNAAETSTVNTETEVKPDAVQDEEASTPSVVVNTPAAEEATDEPKTTAYFTHSAETIFTPNGDGFHDYFEVEGFGVKTFQIRIMNRGGQVVFESNDLNFQWNGNDRFGQPAPEGVYFYAIQAVGTDGLPYLEKNSKGSVTLKR